MPDRFDPYRESLVMEAATIWPEDLGPRDSVKKADVEAALHAAPEECAHLEYIRLYTGFCRQITVTAEDIQRLKAE
jgi:hypothetical protein